MPEMDLSGWLLVGALTGLLISAVWSLMVAILQFPSCTEFLLRQFKLSGATKAAQAAFLDGIRRFLTVYGALGAFASASLYIGVEVLKAGTSFGSLVVLIGIAILAAFTMVFVRGKFMRPQVVVGRRPPKSKGRGRN